MSICNSDVISLVPGLTSQDQDAAPLLALRHMVDQLRRGHAAKEPLLRFMMDEGGIAAALQHPQVTTADIHDAVKMPDLLANAGHDGDAIDGAIKALCRAFSASCPTETKSLLVERLSANHSHWSEVARQLLQAILSAEGSHDLRQVLVRKAAERIEDDTSDS